MEKIFDRTEIIEAVMSQHFKIQDDYTYENVVDAMHNIMDRFNPRTTTDRDRLASPNIQFLIEHSEKCLSEPIAFIGNVDEQKGYKKCLTENIEFLKLYSSVLNVTRPTPSDIVEKCVEAVMKALYDPTEIPGLHENKKYIIRTALRTVLNPE